MLVHLETFNGRTYLTNLSDDGWWIEYCSLRKVFKIYLVAEHFFEEKHADEVDSLAEAFHMIQQYT